MSTEDVMREGVEETELSKHAASKPHYEPVLPYGYRFAGIDLYLLAEHEEWVALFEELTLTHEIHSLNIGAENPKRDRIIWEIARHIEGNFGPPYRAIIVHCAGGISIYTPKIDERWWNAKRWSELSNFLMGMRSALELASDGR